MGNTTVQCSASDTQDNSSSVSFNVAVVDKLPPKLQLPSDMSVVAAAIEGQHVSYVAAAPDAVDGEISPRCTPSSGALFPLGTTTVSCSATDTHGNTTSGSFLVQVRVSWSGALQPISLDGSSVFKGGSTVPVKFQFSGASAAITALPARFYIARMTDGMIGTEMEAVPTAQADLGNQFRYANGLYMFNWGTKGLAQGTWQVRIDLSDGTVNTVLVSIRK